MQQVVRDILFMGVAAPLRLDSADDVLPLLSDVAKGWQYLTREADPASNPFFTISGSSGESRLHCESHVELRPAQLWDPVNAVCDAIASLAVALPLADTRLLCLHAAGVEIDGRLVVFPNVRRAGKSTLSVALARAGYRIFSDDVVPVSFPLDGTPVGHAMGIAPRLRLPLPESLPADFRSWVETVPGPRNRQYHYLSLPRQPGHGERLALGAFVLLDRQEGERADLVPVRPDIAMDALLHQNFTRDRHSGEVLEVIADALAAVPVWQLTYSDLDEAVACLKAAFRETAAPVQASSTEERRFTPARLDEGPDLQMIKRVAQRDGVVARWIGETLYLADPEGRAIQRMDALAAAIWDMLDAPVTFDALEATLVEAYPDTPREVIGSDLKALVARLAEAGLVA